MQIGKYAKFKSISDIFHRLDDGNYTCPKCLAIYPGRWFSITGLTLRHIGIKLNVELVRSYGHTIHKGDCCMYCDGLVESFEFVVNGPDHAVAMPGIIIGRGFR